MSTLRSLIFVTVLYVSMVVLGLVFLPAMLLPRSATMLGIRCWARVARWGMRVIMGAPTEIRGLDHVALEPVLLAPKHQSMIDTLLPFLFLKDPCFVLKKELMYYPIFGMYAAKAEMIAIDRSGSMKALKEMTAKAKAAIAEGRSLVIFPEGTRLAPGETEELKPGIALLYKDLGVPCVPVALNTGYCWPAKGIQRHSGQMVLDLLPPIEPGLNRKVFMQALQTSLDDGTQRLIPAKDAAE